MGGAHRAQFRWAANLLFRCCGRWGDLTQSCLSVITTRRKLIPKTGGCKNHGTGEYQDCGVNQGDGVDCPMFYASEKLV